MISDRLHSPGLDRFAPLVDCAPTPVRWFIVDAGAITDIDYSAAQSMRDLLDDLARQRVGMVFARVSRHLRSDMDRHHITAARAAARFGAHKSDERYQIEAAAAPAAPLSVQAFKLRVF